MSDARIATRYAKSIFILSQERGKVLKVKNDMDLIVNTCEESRVLRLMLSSPIVKFDQKKKILLAIFGDKIQKITAKLIEVICNKNRAFTLQNVAKAYIHLYNESQNLQEVSIKTAFPLEKKLAKEFIRAAQNFTTREIQLKEEVDEELIGGYVLTMDDKQIDDSLRTKLKQLQRKLIS